MNKHGKRPLIINVYIIWLLIVAILNLSRFYQSFRQYTFLQELIIISPFYLVITGVLWGLAFLLLAYGIWMGYKYAYSAIMPLILLYFFYQWIDRLWIAKIFPGNWKFIIVTNITIILITWVLITRSQVKAYFGENNE